jgi:hypothetical protein
VELALRQLGVSGGVELIDENGDPSGCAKGRHPGGS